MIVFYGNQDITVKKKLSDRKGRLHVLDAWIDDFDYYELIAIPQSAFTCSKLTTETLETWSRLRLCNFANVDNHSVVFASDFKGTVTQIT